MKHTESYLLANWKLSGFIPGRLQHIHQTQEFEIWYILEPKRKAYLELYGTETYYRPGLKRAYFQYYSSVTESSASLVSVLM